MGGVFVVHDATPAQEVQFTALQYVTKKLFIAQVTLIQCVKVVKFSIRCTASGDFFAELNLRQLATELSYCIENLFFSLRRWLFCTVDILRE